MEYSISEFSPRLIEKGSVLFDCSFTALCPSLWGLLWEPGVSDAL